MRVHAPTWTLIFFYMNKPKTLVAFFNDPKRWIKHKACAVGADKKTSCCLLGAADRLYNHGYTDVVKKLGKVINTYVGTSTSIISFNDDPKTTFKDIQRVVNLAEV